MDCFAHVHPQVRAGALSHAGALTGVGQVLAGCTAGEDVHAGHLLPVDLCHIPMVRDVRPVMGQHLRGGVLPLAEPGGFRIQHTAHGEVETTHAREHGTDGESHDASPRSNRWPS